ncbi:hypothetical protein FRC12_002917 [Ceratobasidium sp. 428]|nr:hypothetical protein FRC12_002917 [Ceratobasidium sp. 428]
MAGSKSARSATRSKSAATAGPAGSNSFAGVQPSLRPQNTPFETTSSPRHSKRKRCTQTPQDDIEEQSDESWESEEESRPVKHYRAATQPLRVDPTEALSDAVSFMKTHVETGTLASSEMHDRMGVLLNRARIGGAYISGFGVGHVDGLVDLEQDPNRRANPRELDKGHVQDLARVFSEPSAMRDWESPIAIELRLDDIDPACLDEIRACDPYLPGGNIPALKLMDPNNKEIAALEFSCHYHRTPEGQWLDGKALLTRRQRLDHLYALRPRSRLINGNHRIAAIKSIGNGCSASFAKLVANLRGQRLSPEDAESEVHRIAARAKLARYRVIIYDTDKVDAHLRNWLAHNQGSRIAKGMGVSEKTWWLANQMDSWLASAKLTHKATKTPELYNIAHGYWLNSFVAPSGESESSQSSVIKKSGIRRGEWAGFDAASRMLTEPLTTRMLLDTRYARPVYEHVLKGTMASHILNEANTVAALRLWLSIRTLFWLFDVAEGEGFNAANKFISAHPILAEGYNKAVDLWRPMHPGETTIPVYLDHYTPAMMNRFDSLYLYALDDIRRPDSNIEWGSGRTVLILRDVFERFGEWVSRQAPSDIHRRLATSIRLFARLPSPPSSSEGLPHPNFFYGPCALPGKKWMADALGENQSYNHEYGMLALDFSLEKLSPIWTVGAQTVGKSSNSRNWYQRARGYARVFLEMLDCETSSSGVVRLQLLEHQAIRLLSDIRLRNAISGFQKHHGQRVKLLMQSCCINKTASPTFPILRELCEDNPEVYPEFSQLQQSLTKARHWLSSIPLDDSFPTPEELHDYISQLPGMNSLLPPNFFLDFNIEDWLSGWNSAPGRSFQNANSLFGWAIFIRRLGVLFEVYLVNYESDVGRHFYALVQHLRMFTRCPELGKHLPDCPEDEWPEAAVSDPPTPLTQTSPPCSSLSQLSTPCHSPPHSPLPFVGPPLINTPAARSEPHQDSEQVSAEALAVSDIDMDDGQDSGLVGRFQSTIFYTRWSQLS